MAAGREQGFLFQPRSGGIGSYFHHAAVEIAVRASAMFLDRLHADRLFVAEE